MSNAQNDTFAYMDDRRYRIGMAVLSLIFIFAIWPLLFVFNFSYVNMIIFVLIFFIVSDQIIKRLAEKMKDNEKKESYRGDVH